MYLDRDDPANAGFLEELGFLYQPEFYLLSGDGELIIKWVGPIDPDEVRGGLDAVLAAS